MSTIVTRAGKGSPLTNAEADANFSNLNTDKQETSGKDATGGYAGLTLFKINFKNALNTFTSFFTNANTAARTYTFPDYDATIATCGGAETLTNKTLDTPVLQLADASTGGILILQKGSGSTLAGHGRIDIFQQSMRFFENGGTARGLSINLTTLGAGATSTFATTDTAQTFSNKTFSGAVPFVGAANTLTLTGSAAAAPPTLTATGSDTDIDVNIVTKGTGVLKVNGTAVGSGSGSGDLFNFMNGVI